MTDGEIFQSFARKHPNTPLDRPQSPCTSGFAHRGVLLQHPPNTSLTPPLHFCFVFPAEVDKNPKNPSHELQHFVLCLAIVLWQDGNTFPLLSADITPVLSDSKLLFRKTSKTVFAVFPHGDVVLGYQL